MLTLRRQQGFGYVTPESTIDIEYKGESIILSYAQLLRSDNDIEVTLWKVNSTDWGKERFYPTYVALTNNQPLIINDWLKVYGAKINDRGEAVIHLSAPREAIINRRDR